MESVDLTKLSREQLLDLLKKKEATETVSKPQSSVVQSTAPTPEIKESRCCFKSKRAKQPHVPCTKPVTVRYGTVEFCHQHSASTQALEEKAKWQAQFIPVETIQKTEPIVEPLPKISEPPKVVEIVEDTPPQKITPPKPEPPKPKTSAIIQPPQLKSDIQATFAKVEKKLAQTTISAPKPPPPTKKKIIRPNVWGRFEDPDTCIVFDHTTSRAYGLQDRSTGRVLPLREKEIKICMANGWGYDAVPKKPKKPVVPDPVENEEEEESSEEEQEEETEGENEGDENEEEEDEGENEEEEEDEEETGEEKNEGDVDNENQNGEDEDDEQPDDEDGHEDEDDDE
jgi:hypothetical protein